MRHELDAVLVGRGTALADNPRLTARLDMDVSQPVRVVIDKDASLPQTYHLFSDGAAKTIWAVATGVTPQPAADHVEVLGVDLKDGHLDLNDLFDKLGQRNIASVLLESGGGLNAAMVEAGLVQEVTLFMAPKIVGGVLAKTAVEGPGIPILSDCLNLEFTEARPVGSDLLIRGKVR
jgi:diaminohydroxyphosphoribosylaminopyrimidine deaminase/5-amino-6-(5-phosphoribosylamino)uracil reductase